MFGAGRIKPVFAHGAAAIGMRDETTRMEPLRLTRRRLLQLAAALSAASLAGCSLRSHEPLKIAIQPWCGYQFMALARREDRLSPAVQLVPMATSVESIDAVANGTVDGAALTLDQAFVLADRGVDLQLVLIFNVSAGADVVLARPGITRIQDLRGKRVGVESTSLGTIMAAKLLEAASLGRNDVEFVPMGEDHLTGWATLQPLDAIITYEPWRGQLQAQGLQPIFDSRALPQVILDVLAVRRDATRRKGDALRELCAAHFEALGEWRHNPIDTSYRMAPLLGVPAGRVAEVFQGIDLPDVDYNKSALGGPSPELLRSATNIVAILQKAGVLQHTLRPERMFTAAYLPRQKD